MVGGEHTFDERNNPRVADEDIREGTLPNVCGREARELFGCRIHKRETVFAIKNKHALFQATKNMLPIVGRELGSRGDGV